MGTTIVLRLRTGDAVAQLREVVETARQQKPLLLIMAFGGIEVRSWDRQLTTVLADACEKIQNAGTEIRFSEIPCLVLACLHILQFPSPITSIARRTRRAA